MLEILGEVGFFNDQLQATDWIRQNLQFKGRPVYEVIRLIRSRPLFFDDHMNRLSRSCKIVGLEDTVDAKKVQQRIEILVSKCNRTEGNIKVVYGESEPSGQLILLIVFIPHFFPKPEMYQNGVPVSLIRMERVNPNAKLAKEKPKALHDLIDLESGFYEVLMVNSDNVITEGSRSNVFFIREGVFYTSPEEDVLPGITRDKVITIIKSLKSDLRFQRITEEQLRDFEALFLTGTSPGVIPVKSVNEIQYDVQHPLLYKICEGYKKMVENSIQHNAMTR